MVGEEGEAVKEVWLWAFRGPLRSSQPVPWWVWAQLFVIAGVGYRMAFVWPAADFVFVFGGVPVVALEGALIGWRWRKVQMDRQSVRAIVVPELEARRVPIRVVASSGRPALPSGERVG